MNIKKALLTAVVGSLALDAVICIFIFLFGDFGETECKILLTTLILGGYSLTGFCSSFLYEKKKYIPVFFINIGLSILCFSIATALTWGWIDNPTDALWKNFATFNICNFALALSSLLLLVNPKQKSVNGVLFTTIGFIGITSLMLINLVYNIENMEYNEMYFRLLGVFAVLSTLGTITTPILNKIISPPKEGG